MIDQEYTMDESVKAEIRANDPLGIGTLTGIAVARAFINRPYDPAWSMDIWNLYGHSPASIWYHYGSLDMLPDYHPISRRRVEGRMS